MTQATEIPESSQYLLRRERGFVRSSYVVSTATGGDWGRFTRPLRPVRGCLALVLAPAVFLGLIVLACWLAGAFDEDEFRHQAAHDPNSYVAIPLGLLYAALVLVSPMIVTQWIYPANCLVLRDSQNPRRQLLEVRDRMAITMHSVVYTIRGSSGEVLATVRHDLFTRRYEVRDARGQPMLYVASEKSAAAGTETVLWLFTVGVMMILAAVLFRAAASTGLPSGDKGHYYLWWPTDFRDAAGTSMGEVLYGDKPTPQVWIKVDEEVQPRLDRRLLVGLAAVVLAS